MDSILLLYGSRNSIKIYDYEKNIICVIRSACRIGDICQCPGGENRFG